MIGMLNFCWTPDSKQSQWTRLTREAFTVGSGGDDETAGGAVLSRHKAGPQLEALEGGVPWHPLCIADQVEDPPYQAHRQRLEDELGIIQPLHAMPCDWLCLHEAR